jgi:ATP-binding cassette subfamily B protein
LYIIVILLFKDYFKESVTKIKKDSIEVTNYMIESISNYETVKGLKIKDDVYSQFEKKFVINLKNLFNYDNTMCLQRFLKSFISEGGRILIYGIGAIMVSNNSLTFASLLTFGVLLDYFYSPVQELVDLDVDIRNLDLVLDRLNDLSYDTKSSGVSNEILKGNIEFKNLIYSYNDKNNVLDDISLKIKEGEKVIVLGSSGSGKSTLFKILMKYYEINRGMVFVNDIDLNDYKDVDGINYISQNENLFTDSLYNNITLYNKLSIKNLKEITDLCEIDGIIKNNSLGYNMFIEENGFNLSGGERQRIVLARSLLKKFNILIIDEGLNQVDINLERRILKKLFSKFKNKTILIISHRVENLDLFDRKIVIENGVLKCNERRA